MTYPEPRYHGESGENSAASEERAALFRAHDNIWLPPAGNSTKGS